MRLPSIGRARAFAAVASCVRRHNAKAKNGPRAGLRRRTRSGHRRRHINRAPTPCKRMPCRIAARSTMQKNAKYCLLFEVRVVFVMFARTVGSGVLRCNMKCQWQFVQQRRQRGSLGICARHTRDHNHFALEYRPMPRLRRGVRPQNAALPWFDVLPLEANLHSAGFTESALAVFGEDPAQTRGTRQAFVGEAENVCLEEAARS